MIPPLPRNAGPIARLWAGLSNHEARPRAARAPQAACRLAVAAGAGARFLLDVGGARAAAEAAGERAHVPRLRPCSVHEHRAARVPAGRQRRREAAAAVGLLVLRPLLTAAAAAAAAPEPRWEGLESPPAALAVRPSGQRGAAGTALRGPQQVP